MTLLKIPGGAAPSKEIRPIFSAKAGYGNGTILQKIGQAVGAVLSSMGRIAFTAGIALVALFLIPLSMGVIETAALTYPAYLAIAGATGLLTGEVTKHLSDKQVAHLTFSA